MISRLKTNVVGRFLCYLLLINFINLSANFYQSSETNSNILRNVDPVDSLTEMVLEYFLDMDENTVPDTEIPTEERSLLDLKMIGPTNGWSYQCKFKSLFIKPTFFYSPSFGINPPEIISPPPKFRI